MKENIWMNLVNHLLNHLYCSSFFSFDYLSHSDCKLSLKTDTKIDLERSSKTKSQVS